MNLIKEQWDTVKQKVSTVVDNSAYSSWIDPIVFSHISDDKIILNTPSQFASDWVSKNYKQKIEKIWTETSGQTVDIKFDTSVNINNDQSVPPINTVENTNEQAQTIVRTDLNTDYNFDNFILSSTNMLAHNTFKNLLKSSENIFNLMLLHANSGAGKTHLVNAYVNEAVKNTNKRVKNISSEKFMYEFTQSARNNDVLSFKEKMRNNDILVIENIQHIAGKKSTQLELAHTIAHITEAGGQVLITCNISPFLISGIQKELLMKISGGLLIDMKDADTELKTEFIKNYSTQIELQISEESILYLGKNFKGSLKELSGALKRLFMHQSLSGEEISISFMNKVLYDMFENFRVKINCGEIKSVIADCHNITVKEMLSISKVKKLVEPRQISMYLCKTLTNNSLKEIGLEFSGRKHSTVIHAIRFIEAKIDKDINFANQIQLLKDKF